MVVLLSKRVGGVTFIMLSVCVYGRSFRVVYSSGYAYMRGGGEMLIEV